jgi:hypothetical protein
MGRERGKRTKNNMLAGKRFIHIKREKSHFMNGNFSVHLKARTKKKTFLAKIRPVATKCTTMQDTVQC